ncbi:VirB8/TrbF family protein [Xanthomonas citri pv. mangiferaeindicae]|uniref:Conjugative transfer protein n=2 Tax=Xanthomonas axonopodis TaxID=53413 RepID=A0A1T1P6G8_9XANT|nr:MULTISPECIES: type IV secretion system protein [Xanthomonas]OOW51513.1 conjugative transfer protein [Xanthomonas campestris pv. centellae]OOW71235.1 conjugative transfer protein [Xanthomonas axonopodis pv. melhusii]OOW76805.1 conjugative transfer protein [Xanthomonas axonopodis pv. clitoriae]UDB89794.1 conjugative transfer protein [Xanthomonas citri pv. mangiferaeindicae]UDI81412.1 virB8 [Xanthomonas citri pv. mangiferaeindicae]
MLRKKVSEKDGSAQVGAAVQKAVNYEVSIADLARRSEKRAWIVATLSMLVTVMTAGGYYYMLPLKEKVPYLVMADAYSGTSTIAKLEPNFGGRAISTSEALARSNIARFIIARESYDASNISDRDWNTVVAMATTGVLAEYRALHAANNAARPFNVYGRNRAIRISILSITLIGGKGKPFTGATVRFQRSLYDKSSTVSTLLDNKIATMEFAYQDNLQMSEELRVENPLGFRVSDYRVDNDYSALPAVPASGTPAQVPAVAPVMPATQPGLPMTAVQGAVPQGSVPLQQAVPPSGTIQQQPGAMYPNQAQPAIQPQGTTNNVNGANGR